MVLRCFFRKKKLEFDRFIRMEVSMVYLFYFEKVIISYKVEILNLLMLKMRLVFEIIKWILLSGFIIESRFVGGRLSDVEGLCEV